MAEQGFTNRRTHAFRNRGGGIIADQRKKYANILTKKGIAAKNMQTYGFAFKGKTVLIV